MKLSDEDARWRAHLNKEFNDYQEYDRNCDDNTLKTTNNWVSMDKEKKKEKKEKKKERKEKKENDEDSDKKKKKKKDKKEKITVLCSIKVEKEESEKEKESDTKSESLVSISETKSIEKENLEKLKEEKEAAAFFLREKEWESELEWAGFLLELRKIGLKNDKIQLIKGSIFRDIYWKVIGKHLKFPIYNCKEFSELVLKMKKKSLNAIIMTNDRKYYSNNKEFEENAPNIFMILNDLKDIKFQILSKEKELLYDFEDLKKAEKRLKDQEITLKNAEKAHHLQMSEQNKKLVKDKKFRYDKELLNYTDVKDKYDLIKYDIEKLLVQKKEVSKSRTMDELKVYQENKFLKQKLDFKHNTSNLINSSRKNDFIDFI